MIHDGAHYDAGQAEWRRVAVTELGMTLCTRNLDCSSLDSLVGILLFSSNILSVLSVSGVSDTRIAFNEPQAIINIIRERLSAI